MTIDYENQFHEVELADGRRAREPLSARIADRPIELRRETFDFSTGLLGITLPAGDEVELEIGTGYSLADQGGRPIIYLDQNHWVTLTRARWAPEQIDSREELDAALRLMVMARDRAVILPLSSAHLVEAPRRGHRRRQLITTMLELSHGWQMVNPVKIRRQELDAVFRGSAPAAEGVFTLEPGAMFISDPQPTPVSSEFPPALRNLHNRLTSAAAWAAAAIDNDSEPRADELAIKWGQAHHKLAQFMGDNKMGPERARINARAVMLADMQQDIVDAATRVGMGEGEFEIWLERDFEGSLRQMPSVGRVYEVLYRRLRNPQRPAKPGDLNDVFYLCCAAGYADLVVGENDTCHQLRQVIPRVGPGAGISSGLPRLIDQLRDVVRQRITDLASAS
jgi:hypothetical protein